MNSSKLLHTIKLMEEKGYLYKDTPEPGKNSKVHILRRDGQEYILKFVDFSKGHTVIKKRIRSEVNFLKFTSQIGLKICPSLKDYDEKNGWTLQSRLSGVKISRFNSKDVEQVGDFIAMINTEDAIEIANKTQMGQASEYLMGIPEMIEQINNKLALCMRYKIRDEISSKAHHWVKTILMQEYMANREAISKVINMPHWNEGKGHYNISPSDMGVHNTLSDHGKLNFFDFEYSGKDDIAKLIADIILQPEYILNKEHSNLLITKVSAIQNLKNLDWDKKLIDILPLTRIKWCAIMLRPLREGSYSQYHYEKIIKYFEQAGKACESLQY